MRPLTAQEVLSAWEAGRHRPPVDRALLLLAKACPAESWDALARLPIGQRDAQLLTLREWTFGPNLVSVARCPACGERLELNFTVDDVRTEAASSLDEDLSLSVAGYAVRFRLPNSEDLMALAGTSEEEEARRHLLGRCLLAAHRDEGEVLADELPPDVTEAVVRQMSEADPQANVYSALHCPSCAHAWQVAFDIVAFFWAELETWAYRTLREVHMLARAYGWREADILALSPWRRQFYLAILSR